MEEAQILKKINAFDVVLTCYSADSLSVQAEPNTNESSISRGESKTLSDSVVKLLDDRAPIKMSARSIAKALIEAGYKTETNNFNIIVSTTCRRLAEKSKIILDNSGVITTYTSVVSELL